MPGILVVAEHRNGRLDPVSAELAGLARSLSAQLGGRVALAVVGGDEQVTAQAQHIAGVDEVVAAPGEPAQHVPELVEEVLMAMIAQLGPELVLFAHTVDAMSVAPALAVRIGAGFVSDAVALTHVGGELIASRFFYGGKVQAEVALAPGRLAVATVRPGGGAAAVSDRPAPVRTLSLATPTERWTEHIRFVEPAGDDSVDIAAAVVILCIGRGIGERENLARFEALAGRMGATLGVSRPLVDAGWVPSARQIGQSGRTVAPRVYLGLGVSGAVQHLAGIRDADTIIAVNTDREAPIFDVADYGSSLDLFEVAEELDRQFGP
jgi:electron transfer flavoprotein alpha subunit